MSNTAPPISSGPSCVAFGSASWFFQRALPAFLAIALRFSGVNFAARALPPLIGWRTGFS